MSNILKNIGRIFRRSPAVSVDIKAILRDAKQKNLINTELFGMIEGVLEIAKMQASDVMVPKPSMKVLEAGSDYQAVLTKIAETAHSRYPVVSKESHDEVVGILLAKDLLNFTLPGKQAEFRVKSMLRDVVVVPETKRLDALLREFRLMHNHMAIVVDEYGSVVGLVTIEDVLEEIVGEIEDEYDTDEVSESIEKLTDKTFVCDAQLSLEDFNDYFKTQFSSAEFNTIGGVIMHAFGYLPAVNEEVTINQYHFKVIEAGDRQIRKVVFSFASIAPEA